MVQHGFPASHAVADSKFDVFTAKLTLGLVKGRELINHTIADIQSVQSPILDVNSMFIFFNRLICRIVSNAPHPRRLSDFTKIKSTSFFAQSLMGR